MLASGSGDARREPEPRPGACGAHWQTSLTSGCTMGGISSVLDGPHGDMGLKELVGPKTIPLSHPFWGHIMAQLDAQLEVVESSLDAMRLLRAACRGMTDNLKTSDNLRNLVVVLVASLEATARQPEGKEASSETAGRYLGSDSAAPAAEQIGNLLFLTRVFLKHVIEALRGQKRADALALRPKYNAKPDSTENNHEVSIPVAASPPTSPTKPSPVPSYVAAERLMSIDRQTRQELPARLFSALLGALLRAPIDPDSDDLQVETISFLIVLATEPLYSTEFQSGGAAGQGWVLDLLLDEKATPAKQLINRLLEFIATNGDPVDAADGVGRMVDNSSRTLARWSDGPVAVGGGDSTGEGSDEDETINTGDTKTSSDSRMPSDSSGGRKTNSRGVAKAVFGSLTGAMRSIIIDLPLYMLSVVSRILPLPSASDSKDAGGGAQLAESQLRSRAMMLFLVLVHQDTRLGPYKAIVKGLLDPDGVASDTSPRLGDPQLGESRGKDNEKDAKTTVSDDAKLSVSFGLIYDEIVADLPKPSAILVIYTLLAHNTGFRQAVFAKTDVDVLAVPLLRMLHDETDLQSNDTYMALITLVILTADPSFCQTLHSHLRLPHGVEWFRDANLGSISVGSLTVAVLLRIITLNLSYDENDLYLHTNCLGALANMAPYCRGLHPYACAQLTGLIDTLAKRYREAAEASEAKDSSQNPELEALEGFLKLSLQVAAGCLAPAAAPHNASLVVELLRIKPQLAALHQTRSRMNGAFGGVLGPLRVLLEEAEMRALEGAKLRRGTDGKIKSAIARYAADKGFQTPVPVPAKFVYEEQANSHEFFLPYIWKMIFSLDSIPYLVTQNEDQGDGQGGAENKSQVEAADAADQMPGPASGKGGVDAAGDQGYAEV